MGQVATRYGVKSVGSLRGPEYKPRNHQRMRQRGRSRATDLLISGVILLAAAAAILLYTETGIRLEEAKGRNQEAQDRLEGLQVETERVQNEIHKLQTDPAFVESVARIELGLVRSGDVVIKLDSASGDFDTRQVSATSADRFDRSGRLDRAERAGGTERTESVRSESDRAESVRATRLDRLATRDKDDRPAATARMDRVERLNKVAREKGDRLESFDKRADDKRVDVDRVSRRGL